MAFVRYVYVRCGSYAYAQRRVTSATTERLLAPQGYKVDLHFPPPKKKPSCTPPSHLPRVITHLVHLLVSFSDFNAATNMWQLSRSRKPRRGVPIVTASEVVERQLADNAYENGEQLYSYAVRPPAKKCRWSSNPNPVIYASFSNSQAVGAFRKALGEVRTPHNIHDTTNPPFEQQLPNRAGKLTTKVTVEDDADDIHACDFDCGADGWPTSDAPAPKPHHVPRTTQAQNKHQQRRAKQEIAWKDEIIPVLIPALLQFESAGASHMMETGCCWAFRTIEVTLVDILGKFWSLRDFSVRLCHAEPRCCRRLSS
jgi:hypothetical protein